MAYIGLTQRAILDIQEIESLSIEKWGVDTASDYLQSIENALNLLRENPQSPQSQPSNESEPVFLSRKTTLSSLCRLPRQHFRFDRQTRRNGFAKSTDRVGTTIDAGS